MEAAERSLTVSDTGRFADLVRRPLPEGLVLVFVPSLAAILTRARDLKGAELTRDEVVRIRDESAVLVTLPQAARAIEERRGYADLDPSEPWESWLRLTSAGSDGQAPRCGTVS
jgi:hypothetical protein